VPQTGEIGYWCGVAAATATAAYDVVQILQDVRPGKSSEFLCQNCVTCPPKPWVNNVVYGDTSMPIDVACSCRAEVRW
jgi:hypothetical protein